MNEKWKKRFVHFLSAIVVVILLIAAYFYMEFMGNPFVQWQQQNALIQLYEDRYQEEFDLRDSNYDYKRNEFTFKVAPTAHPNNVFTTTLHEARSNDVYAELRATDYLKGLVYKALGTDYSDLTYSFNIYEDNHVTGALEMDTLKRLSLNGYTVSFSFDVEKTDTELLNALFSAIYDKVSNVLAVPVGELTLRFSVYDGTRYHHGEIKVPPQ